jgi:hypothetical protein
MSDGLSKVGHDIVIAATRFWGDGDSIEEPGIADQIWEERFRQILKRGLQTRPDGTSHDRWYPSEVQAKAEYEATGEGEDLTWVHILKEEVYEAFAEEDPEKLKVELVQVMAVAAQWLQDLQLNPR